MGEAIMGPPQNLAVVVERLENLKHDVNEKHKQNRNDIHGIRNKVQDVLDIMNDRYLEFATFKTKVIAYATMGGAIAGFITTIVNKLIDHIWK